MRKFRFEKLIRDNIISSLIQNGNSSHNRKLNRKEFLSELRKKIIEEATELEFKSKKENINELADLQEIIDCIASELKLTRSEIRNAQKAKNKQFGSFKKKIYVEYVEVEESSEWIKHYKKYPLRYPEVK